MAEQSDDELPPQNTTGPEGSEELPEDYYLVERLVAKRTKAYVYAITMHAVAFVPQVSYCSTQYISQLSGIIMDAGLITQQCQYCQH